MSNDITVPGEPDEFEDQRWTSVHRVGDTLSGELTERSTLTTDKHGGGEAELLRIRNGDGVEWEVPCWRAHLRQLVEKRDPHVGDHLLVRYFGPEPGGRQELYAMRVARKGAQQSLEARAATDDEIESETTGAITDDEGAPF
jgi:hypothetical protein